MLRLDWSVKALIDFDEAQAYIAQENSFAVQTVAERIWQASQRLADTPLIGCIGVEPETRHWGVQRTPYLIVYRVTEEAVEILRVRHGRRDWMEGDGG